MLPTPSSRIAPKLAPLLCALTLIPAAAQTPPDQLPSNTLVFHVETREAGLDVVARDRHNLPINDLTIADFEIYELPERSARIPRRILSLHTVDPQHPTPDEESTNGFSIHSGAICALNATVHYRITIPASPQPGYHTILIKTKRSHSSLTYRKRYYVGHTPDDITPKDLQKLITPDALHEAACYHPLTPPTLAMTARVLGATADRNTRYAAVIKPESLGQLGIDDTATGNALPHLQLDFGICIFNASGEVTDYRRSSLDQEVTEADKAKLQERGFAGLLDLLGKQPPPLVRLAVLDRNTGNLGVVDVVRPSIASSSKTTNRTHFVGDIRAFGSVTPSQNAFCGDVYELTKAISSTSDFQNLEPVASIYTTALDVPTQDITQQGGIPGVTHSSAWFGVDYYGKFFITNPGKYTFELKSDDGSQLEIDDHPLINLDGIHPSTSRSAKINLSSGWHTVHVPYFQGPPPSLALVLGIQPPNEPMRPFKLSDFLPEAATQ